MSDDVNSKPPARTGVGKFIGAALVAVALIAFVVQNTDSTPVQWFFIDRSAPLWLIIVISAVAGAILSEVLGWIVRRRR
ncbi:MAG: LapA family protein [Acidimicrobiaceae bacterium]|nr:LapA family protein [Acidimicrobiaceae bacterium]MXW76539.1 LapA family protein [Acidimicrobiaceae bacterium]MYA73828.1 LapA family protein [Acidimicrobiaceae bacterium]MYD06021.1 LapA family protein [Acidimicrobiaceae bacterium]MYG54853.1 LapA family protein [Acidimicrobiaceae bacterium]